MAPSSSVNVNVAENGFAVAGVNVRFTMHVLPAATVAPFMQVVPVAIAKSAEFVPPRTTAAICSTSVPVFVNVTVCTALVVLMI
jgi:hypothetical protein